MPGLRSHPSSSLTDDQAIPLKKMIGNDAKLGHATEGRNVNREMVVGREITRLMRDEVVIEQGKPVAGISGGVYRFFHVFLELDGRDLMEVGGKALLPLEVRLGGNPRTPYGCDSSRGSSRMYRRSDYGRADKK